MIGLLFLLGVVGEVASLVVAGSRLGALWTLGLLVGSFALGFALLSGRGSATIRAALASVTQQASPAPALVDGVLMVIAAVLFITPGFLSDLVAVIVVLPPVRARLRDRFLRTARTRLQTRLVVAPDGVRSDVIDVEATEVPARDAEPPPRLPGA